MGYGEVAGNQSVHWQIDHEGTTPITVTPNNGNRPTQAHRVHHRQARLQGRDPKPVAEINGDGYFRVRMRFDSQGEFEKEVAAALVSQASQVGDFYVELKVKAVQRADPDLPPDAEVKVRW